MKDRVSSTSDLIQSLCVSGRCSCPRASNMLEQWHVGCCYPAKASEASQPCVARLLEPFHAVSEVLNELMRHGCRVLAGFVWGLRLQASLSNMVSDSSRRFA